MGTVAEIADPALTDKDMVNYLPALLSPGQPRQDGRRERGAILAAVPTPHRVRAGQVDLYVYGQARHIQQRCLLAVLLDEDHPVLSVDLRRMIVPVNYLFILR